MCSINYSVNQATRQQISNHLKVCSSQFSPSLDSYVDIKVYAEKIAKFAITFEAWEESDLIGLVACYLNDKSSKIGYITNVSVFKRFQGKGIAKKLLKDAFSRASSLGFNEILLEVEKDNLLATGLYKRLGFSEIGMKNSKMLMRINLFAMQ